ncbi:hypothetical protein ACS8FB_05160 [Psychrobacter sp. 1U1]|uniref:hypothetical protein n=1 Tax=Psychrobacter sp. 1U1 TaxID=3453576 RepID=UPI003F453C4D
MLLLNQAFMMLWEAILENATLVIMLLLVLLVAWGYWVIKGRHKKLAYRVAGVLSAIVAVIGFFVLPMLFKASLADLNYWVDWAFHLTMVVALLVYAYLVLLPLMTGLIGAEHRA